MNKKDQATFDTLKQELALERAMRRTAPVSRDVAPPKLGYSAGSLSLGWDAWAMSGANYGFPGRVEQACSSSVSHGTGWEKTSSQRPRSLYSSELRAYQALRHELGETCAQMLSKVDAKIEELSTAAVVD